MRGGAQEDAGSEEPDVEVLVKPLTRPPYILGVDLKVFVLNMLLGLTVFIATSSFLLVLIVIPIHFLAAYFCQQDAHIVQISTVIPRTRLVFFPNFQFWGARSYSP